MNLHNKFNEIYILFNNNKNIPIEDVLSNKLKILQKFIDILLNVELERILKSPDSDQHGGANVEIILFVLFNILLLCNAIIPPQATIFKKATGFKREVDMSRTMLETSNSKQLGDLAIGTTSQELIKHVEQFNPELLNKFKLSKITNILQQVRIIKDKINKDDKLKLDIVLPVSKICFNMITIINPHYNIPGVLFNTIQVVDYAKFIGPYLKDELNSLSNEERVMLLTGNTLGGKKKKNRTRKRRKSKKRNN